MNVHQIRQNIIESIHLSDVMIVESKKFLLSYSSNIVNTFDVFTQFLRAKGISELKEVVIHDSVPLEPQVKQVANYYSYFNAFTEALWDLIHRGDFIIHDQNLVGPIARVSWTDIIPGSGGTRSSWDFSELNVYIPRHVKKPISRSESTSTLSLIPLETGITNAHSEVNEALQDALDCFRQELYRPSVVMLGKAIEGAWIELGITLAGLIPVVNKENINKGNILDEIKSPRVGISTKVNKISSLYIDNFHYFKELAKLTGIGVYAIKEIKTWSDVILNSRNAIHFDAEPIIENTYEKVAILLMSTPEYLNKIYKLKENADKHQIVDSPKT